MHKEVDSAKDDKPQPLSLETLCMQGGALVKGTKPYSTGSATKVLPTVSGKDLTVLSVHMEDCSVRGLDLSVLPLAAGSV
jgi:hypothetical protein